MRIRSLLLGVSILCLSLFVLGCRETTTESPTTFFSTTTITTEEPVTTTATTTSSVSNRKVEISGYLTYLLGNYQLDPYNFIPDSMKADFSTHLIEEGEGVYDYSQPVNLSDIAYGGFGEQWNMVLNNLNQSKVFFDALSLVEGLITTSVISFNNYLDTNPESTAHHEFEIGIYSVTIDFDGTNLKYVLDYTGTLPVLGEQQSQIYLSYNTATLEKECRIQLGSANVVKYIISEDSYRFAVKYLGVRVAYFEVLRDAENNVKGTIVEYVTLGEGVSLHRSAAQFHIDDDYVSVVGNKTDSLPVSYGYINELYLTDTGLLQGYEVRKSLSETVDYNTMWFNLNSTSGINSIKRVERANGINPHTVFVNDADTAFATKNVGGIGLKTLSRRYDIEFRTQYLYRYDSEQKMFVEVVSEVPMLFVQQENLNTLNQDINNQNNYLNFSLLVSNTVRNKIISDHESLIDIFISSSDEQTIDSIYLFIADPYAFTE
ncbi:MAG: hypothetical protein ACOX16_05010 [Candidatus Izemoplasmatales bacterium]|jgi:hypothetical protein